MGKNLKGKDCGKGIYQRKDRLYRARFVDKAGKRREKYVQTLPEARNWIENIVGDLAPNTLRNYRERYVRNIQPVIGKTLIAYYVDITQYKSMRKWRKNGVVAKTPECEKPCKYGIF